ncbi:GSCOCG00011005001-RA-CDS, partial [Cotesia congregata]
VVLSGVKKVGNKIKGGWNFADNVVDGSLNLAKQIGSLGYKIVTVVPKSLNDVLLDIVEKGQKKLTEKLENERNKDKDKNKDEDKNKDSTTKAPETTDGELFIYLNNLKIPVTPEQIVEVANVLKGTKDHFPLVADPPPQPYFVLINHDEA